MSPSERIDSIDMLRGLALFGVLAINLVTEFRVSIFEQFLPSDARMGPLDRAVEAFLMLAVDFKAFALFSLLFGVGLAIQFERLAHNPRRTVLLLRRLTLLLAIGLVHLLLIWNGDILVEYALAGFLVLPFLGGPRRLLAAAAAAFLALYLMMPLLPPPVSLPAAGWMANHVVEADRIYRSGGFSEVLAFRIGEVSAILPLHVLVFPRTVGLFLLGAFAWRSGALRPASARAGWQFAIAIAGILLGATLTLAAEGSPLFGWPSLGRAYGPVERSGAILLAVGYAAGVFWLVRLTAGRKMLGWAAPLGRMAFTNYLLQSVIFGWIFYGYGLGLFGRLDAATALGLGIAVYAAQAAFSRWWLARHRFGPVEWLWRSLMYGAPQRMRLV